MWPDHRLMDLLNIKSPIVQAPMAGANGSAMVIENLQGWWIRFFTMRNANCGKNAC